MHAATPLLCWFPPYGRIPPDRKHCARREHRAPCGSRNTRDGCAQRCVGATVGDRAHCYTDDTETNGIAHERAADCDINTRRRIAITFCIPIRRRETVDNAIRCGVNNHRITGDHVTARPHDDADTGFGNTDHRSDIAISDHPSSRANEHLHDAAPTASRDTRSIRPANPRQSRYRRQCRDRPDRLAPLR